MNQNEQFFANNNASTNANYLNDEQKIQEILQEQQKLQQLYNQLVAYIQEHQNMPSDEMFKYHAQLKQLTEYYQANQEKLKLLWYSNIQVNKNVQIKRGAASSLSVKNVFMGCGILFFLLVIGLIVLFYTVLQNPTGWGGLTALGIAPAVAKNLLMGLTGIAMLIVFLVGIVILLMNVYKAFTVKDRPKTWYIWGGILGFLILWIGIGAGTSLMSQVSKIEVESLANPDQTVLAYVKTPTKDNPDAISQISNSTILIAPVNVPFKLLTANYQKYAQIELGNQQVTNLQLDCGNKQILTYNQQSTMFNGACFYSKKGIYQISLIISYIDNTTKQTVNKSYLLKEINVASELSLSTTSDKKLELIDNEYVLGPLPSELTFNADQIFRDLGLRNYRINWDAEGDGTTDKSDETTFSFNYEKAEVYYPSFSLPDYNPNIIFSFPLRVEKSLLPVCKIEFSKQKVNTYRIQASFLDGGEKYIQDYAYLISDASTKQSLADRQGNEVGMDFIHTFDGQGFYEVLMNFVTTEGKKGSCRGELRISDKSSFNVDYDIFSQSPRQTQFTKIDKKLISDSKSIKLSEIPTKLKLKINSIQPSTYNINTQITLDTRPIVETLAGEYLFDVRDTKAHTLKIQIQDTVRGLSYEESINITIGLDDVLWDLKVVGEKSWFSPLVVTLDASATKLNDPNDSIAYFTWDFDDGEVQNNLSTSVIKHTYIYNNTKNTWIFTPKVTITTKKGRTITVPLSESIIVNKPLVKLNISSPSHPTQEARIWDQVRFALDFNGLPKKIYRSFDDGNEELACDGRECIEMTKVFEKAGSYNIKVRMEFDDQQQVEQSFLFKVRK